MSEEDRSTGSADVLKECFVKAFHKTLENFEDFIL